MMRVCFVNSTRRWGGVKTWTADLCNWMSGHGHEPMVVARPGPFAERCRRTGAQVVESSFGFDFNPLLIRRFVSLFRRAGVQAVVCNVSKDLRSAGIAARLAGLPLIQRVGLPGDMKNAFKIRFLHRRLRPALLAPCEFVRTGMLENLPHLAPGEITAIHTGKTPAQGPPKAVNRPLRLAVTSQLNPDKGHAGLLAALSRLAARGLDFELRVAGTGSEEAALKRAAMELGIFERVRWLGFVTDVRAMLADCDSFVLASRSEGLPNTLLEAMAEGLVPVARPVGGVPEVWPDALGHLLATMDETDAGLERCLEKVLEAGDEDILAWKAESWQTCRECFDLDTQAARTIAWIESLAARGRR